MFYLCDMKIRNLLIIVVLALTAVSCNKDVDLYAEPKDIPVIYGLLDSDADTNYIRITHAYHASDNPLLNATNAAMSEYPGKLDVRLTVFRNGDSIRQIILDTITIHNKKPGTFYAPHQKVYYTNQPMYRNSSMFKYRYRLSVVLPERTLVTDADLVGSADFGPKGLPIILSKTAWGLRMPYKFIPAENATIYSVDMAFTYHERRTPTSDTIPFTMMWHIGNFYKNEVIDPEGGSDYVFHYRSENFYYALEEFIGADTCVPGLKRFITEYPVRITITAGGDNLQKYLYYMEVVNQNNPNDADFSTIPGAKGVFSSKMTKSVNVRLAGTTLPELIADSRWGFAFMGGGEP